MTDEKIGLRLKRKQDWFWLENKVIDNENMKTYEKMIYIVLIRFCNNETGSCYPSFATIASKAGCSVRQVRNIIKELENKKLIKKVSRKIPGTRENDSNLYYIYSIENSLYVGNEMPNPREYDSPQVGNEMPSNKTNMNKTNIYIDLSFLNMDIENVFLSEIEYKKLIGRYDENYIKELIVSLENYIVNGKGKKYKSHYKTLLAWAAKDPKAPKSKVIVNDDAHQLKRIGIDDSKISKLS